MSKYSRQEFVSCLQYTRNNLAHVKETSRGVFYLDPSAIGQEEYGALMRAVPDTDLWKEWQVDLQITALWNQNGLCSCGEPLQEPVDLHHAIVSRRDVQGIKDLINKNTILHHSFNVVLVCRSHHDMENRDKNFDFLCWIYGRDSVLEWYNSIPLKSLVKRS